MDNGQAEIDAPVWRELARNLQHLLLRHVPAMARISRASSSSTRWIPRRAPISRRKNHKTCTISQQPCFRSGYAAPVPSRCRPLQAAKLLKQTIGEPVGKQDGEKRQRTSTCHPCSSALQRPVPHMRPCRVCAMSVSRVFLVLARRRCSSLLC